MTRWRRVGTLAGIALPVAVAAGATLGAALVTPFVTARRVSDRRGRDWFALPDGHESTVHTSDGANLAVFVAGPPAGPVVVLAHCWTGTKETWAPVARRLVRLGHRVVLYDQRGHGSSGFGTGLRDVDTLGDDLAVVLEHVDARGAVVAGHSMGGMAVQAHVARRCTGATDRIAAVVLVATAARVLGRSIPTGVANRALGDASPAWVRSGRSGALVARAALGRGAVPAHVAFVRDTLDATAAPVRVSCLLAMARMDLRPGLAEAAVPATILVGSRDLLTPPRLARALWRAWPGSSLRVLPGAGHMLPLEDPDHVVEAITRAAAGVDPGMIESPSNATLDIEALVT